MEKESALYQLMGVRMNGVMNGITNSDGEYQEIIRKSDEYSGRPEELNLPEEVRLLIDRYVSMQNAIHGLFLVSIELCYLKFYKIMLGITAIASVSIPLIAIRGNLRVRGRRSLSEKVVEI